MGVGVFLEEGEEVGREHGGSINGNVERQDGKGCRYLGNWMTGNEKTTPFEAAFFGQKPVFKLQAHSP